jgi:hypothetical protein
MAIVQNALDANNIAFELIDPDQTLNIFSLNLETGVATSDYMPARWLQIMSERAQTFITNAGELFDLPERRRGALNFLQRFVNTSPLDDSALALSVTHDGDVYTLVANVTVDTGNPAHLVVNLPHSLAGAVAMASAVTVESSGIGFLSGDVGGPSNANSINAGVIVDEMVSETAGIQQYKIDGLVDALASKALKTIRITAKTGGALVGGGDLTADRTDYDMDDTFTTAGTSGGVNVNTLTIPVVTVDAYGRASLGTAATYTVSTNYQPAGIYLKGVSADPYSVTVPDPATNTFIVPTLTSGRSNFAVSTVFPSKTYVDNLALGLVGKDPVNAATIAELPDAYTATPAAPNQTVLTRVGNGALPTIDGVTLTAGQRVLIKNETGSKAPYNGIYVVTQVGSSSLPWILTRSADANTAVSLCGSIVAVIGGSQATDLFFFAQSPIGFALGTNPVIFIQVSGNIVPATSTVLGGVQLLGGIGGTGSAYNGVVLKLSDAVYLDGNLLATRGGTGVGSYAAGDMLYANGVNPTALSKLAIGTNGQYLQVVGGVPSWQTSNFATIGTSLPQKLGTANAGSGTAASAVNHVHPLDGLPADFSGQIFGSPPVSPAQVFNIAFVRDTLVELSGHVARAEVLPAVGTTVTFNIYVGGSDILMGTMTFTSAGGTLTLTAGQSFGSGGYLYIKCMSSSVGSLSNIFFTFKAHLGLT